MPATIHPFVAHDDAPPASALPTLLIVDDSSMMRLLLKRAALATGVPLAAVLEAANGVEALRLLESQHVDALFTDITMPEMNGIELLRHVAANPRLAHLTRVVISTDGSDTSRAEAEALAVSQYVTKPFPPEAMRAVLAALSVPR
jgi:CheY-like chemotaxis protein